MLFAQGLSILAALAISTASAAPEIKTTYDISGSAAEARTKLKDAPTEYNQIMHDWLWKGIAKTFLKGSFVSGIQQTDAKESVESYEWNNYKTHKRTFGAFISLNLPARVSLLVEVEEELRRCKDSANQQAAASGGGDEFGGVIPASTAACQLSAKTTIKGPLAVYGNFASTSGLNMDRLLRDKQEIVFKAERSYDLKDISVETTFKIQSMLFEQSLLKFLDAFNVAGIASSPELLTRQRILLGIARIGRQANERMIEL